MKGLEAAYKKHGSWDTSLKGKPFKFGQALAKIIPTGSKVIDIGAGVGRHVRVLQDHGFDVIGLDGTPGIEEISGGLVKQVDLTVTAECYPYFKMAEWGICWGVGEHVPACLDQIFLDNIMAIPTDGIIVCWARPGTPGKGHINCRPFDEILHEFDRNGWVRDEEKTQIIFNAFGRKKPTAAVFLN